MKQKMITRKHNKIIYFQNPFNYTDEDTTYSGQEKY